MKPTRFVPFVVLVLTAASLPAQFDPPPSKKIDDATRKAIAVKLEKLEKALAELRKPPIKRPVDQPRTKEMVELARSQRQLADVEVYLKAGTWIVRHDEFYDKDSPAWTLETLDRGLERAEQFKKGQTPWIGQAGRTVVRGYLSVVDSSFQPYAVTLPSDYGKDPEKKHRLDVVLHGRESSLTEVKFIHRFHDKPAPKDLGYIRIDVYGRGNVAYRWAGETDLRQAAAASGIRIPAMLDDQDLGAPRILRGFSMGGAGTWHLGLHRPDRWTVIGPGAGFTTTHGYIKGLPEKLPPYQEKCLHIYDAVDYAENAFNVPVVAYSGEKDPQKAAADNIEKRVRELKIPMTHLIAPGLAHQFPPDWQKKAEAEYAKHIAKGKDADPKRIRFVTYTLKYPRCNWVSIYGLERHFERARVDAERTEKGFTVRTENVRILLLYSRRELPKSPIVRIDGQELEIEPALVRKLERSKLQSVLLERHDGRWRAISRDQMTADQKSRPQKTRFVHGPIDDAFMGAFLCVRGTGKPWHDATQKYADGNLERFRYEWSKYLRGDLPIKNDTDVTADDIARKHLVLFGDPASNSLIGKVVGKLPLQWTKERVTFAGKTGNAAEQVPVLIYPNPLNPRKYVVLNSGHTFHEADFRGTNALLYPRLGDYALLKLAPTAKDQLAIEVVTAGLFDDFWKIN